MISSLLVTILVTLLYSSHIHSYQLTNGTSNENPNVHCVPMPVNLRLICSHDIGWQTRMQLPNFLGHKTYEELTDEVNSIAILHRENLNKLECKGLEQLKLVLCATVSPMCLDVVLPPCKQLCMRAKASCRLALQRHGIDWPRLLDCRRFPSAPEVCINRALPYIPTETNDLPMKTSEHSLNSTITTTKVKHRGSPAAKRRRKEKKERGSNATTTTSTTTSYPVDPHTTTTTISVFPAVSLDDLHTHSSAENDTLTGEKRLTTSLASIHNVTTPTSQPISSPTAEQATTTTAEAPSTMSESQLRNTTETPRSVDAGLISNQENGSSVIKQDLTRFLCSSSPEWLIKTKLTDNQLMVATKKRKLRVRSYRQIFGNLVNTNTTLSGNRRARAKTSAASSVYLSLSNSTDFIYPMGPSLHRQSMSLDSTSDKQRKSDASTQSSPTAKTSSKTYLIFGTTDSAEMRMVTHVILWPGSKFNKDSDLQANGEIIKTYRDFKLRELAACGESDAHTAS